MVSVTVGSAGSGQRADKYIKKCWDIPTSLMYKYFRKKRIKVNGKKCAPEYVLNPGDVLELYINDDILKVPVKTELPDSLPDPSVVYEDENIIIMDKPAGLDSHASSGDSMLARMILYLRKKKEYIPENSPGFAPALCNRLDRNTEGLIIGAKNAQALRETDRQIKLGNIRKYYICLCEGNVKPKKGTLEDKVKKDYRTGKTVSSEDGKTAKLSYEVKGYEDGISLVEVRLETGRTHQIRMQFAKAGFPLAGDFKYGAKNRSLPFRYQALRSFRILFDISDENSCLYGLNRRKIEQIGENFAKYL